MSDDQTVDSAAGGTEQTPPARDPKELADAAAEILRQQAVPDENPMEPIQMAPSDTVPAAEPEAQGEEPTATIAPPAETYAEGDTVSVHTTANGEHVVTAPTANPMTGQTDADTSGLTDFQRAMNASTSQAKAVDDVTTIPEDAGFLSREQAQKNVAAALGEGVEIYLPKTGSKALVRDLPFTDYVMLQGIPTELIKAIDDTVRDSRMQEMARTGADAAKTLGDALEMWSKAEQTANAVCIASFIKPKLVMRENELDPTNPLIWLVTDVALEDRLAVLQWSNRNRQARVAAQGGAVAVAGFPG